MQKVFAIGGLVAVGVDRSGDYLLTISHSGRGVFSTKTWEKIARDTELAYPENGIGVGIGPVKDEKIPVKEINYDTEILQMRSPDARFSLTYQEGTVKVEYEA